MKTIKLIPATERFADLIPGLIHSTGSVSYDYVFLGNRTLMENFLAEAWKGTDTLFSHNEATLALDGDELLGIEIGYPGTRLYELREGGAEAAMAVIETGLATPEQFHEVGLRDYRNNFQIPHVPPDAYYVMALAVSKSSRGLGIGAQLFTNACDQARAAGFRTLHLDVLSDNPAVEFYKRLGMACMVESSVPELRDHHGIPVEYRMVKVL